MNLDWVEIGYVRRAHGIKGELLLKLYDGEASFLSPGVILKIGSEQYEIFQIKPHKEDFILKSKAIPNRNLAETLKGKNIFVVSGLLITEKDSEELYLRELLGFEVYLEEESKGPVTGFLATPAHDLILVDGKFEIPWVKDFVQLVDREEQKVVLNCPQDLFDADFILGSKK